MPTKEAIELDANGLPPFGSDEAKALPFYIGPSGVRKEVLVENPSNHFVSPLGQYLFKPSLGDPSKHFYRKVSDDPLYTAGRQMTLLDCAVEDADAILQANDKVASRSFSAVADSEKKEFGGIERGEPVGIF